jgi:hypothetical protein
MCRLPKAFVQWPKLGSMQRQACLTNGCVATFEASAAREGEVRHCNRAGPDGGHVHRWDGQHWQVVAGEMEHDRS